MRWQNSVLAFSPKSKEILLALAAFFNPQLLSNPFIPEYFPLSFVFFLFVQRICDCLLLTALIARYLLLTTYCSLLTTHCLLLATRYSLPITLCSLLSTLYSLLTTHYSLFATHYSLLTPHSSLLTTHYSLPTTHFSLLATYCPLLARCGERM